MKRQLYKYDNSPLEVFLAFQQKINLNILEKSINLQQLIS